MMMETLVGMCSLLGYRYCKVHYKHENSLVKYFLKLIIYFWLCSAFVATMQSFFSCGGYCLVALCGLLIAVASLAVEH